MVVFLDYVMVFLKKRGDNLTNLQHIFDRFHKHGISFNPKKSIFVVSEVNLLVHVICKDGSVINPKEIESITTIAYPNNNNSMQYFLGKINFFHRFVSIFVEIIKPLQSMIKRDAVFKWNHEIKQEF